ncbi:chemotaxis protein [Antarctobacter heliothermus]|uniref:Aerotaxis receptor n=1 Tax=Antarctobacter heliothermus TaxID=74033 RepID=A0A239LFV0_9RHOB|nr:chemotaxis protein [Antarctobacter heliothermus]SNT28394.1 aerotaxis receptor [Antarctobacter heliothermus]
MSELDPAFPSRVSNAEAKFQLSEAIYSRTDKRGIIQAGNEVFQRVAGHDWDHIIGAPHKLIRHPDMPRGVFHFLWERLKAGQPTGAYVKNRRSCGRFYWVFALVAPTEDGYVSTRIKPVSSLRAEVEEFYGDLVKREAAGANPAESAANLCAWVREQGFTSYDAFQSHALATEFEARTRQLGRTLDPRLKRFVDMTRAISDVWDEATMMTEGFKAIRTVPMNMRIIASRLENAGGPISAISVNYSQMLEEMTTWVKTFVEGDDCVFAHIRNAVLMGQFLAFASAAEREMISAFGATDDAYPHEVDVAREIAELTEHEERFMQQVVENLSSVEREARRFAHSVLDMKRFVTGLSSTRMMCKIESASLSESGTALTGIVEQLDSCQEEIEQRLARVMDLNAVIQNSTSMLRSML